MESDRLTKKDIFSMFIRSNFLLGSFNFERAQALGYCYVMIPAIKKLIRSRNEAKRSTKAPFRWFNTHPWMSHRYLASRLQWKKKWQT